MKDLLKNKKFYLAIAAAFVLAVGIYFVQPTTTVTTTDANTQNVEQQTDSTVKADSTNEKILNTKPAVNNETQNKQPDAVNVTNEN